MYAWHNKDHKCVQNAFRYVVFTGQFLGLLAVTDATSNPRFKWSSPKVLYGVVLILGNATILLFTTIDWHTLSPSFATMNVYLYKSGVCCMLIFYLRFAKKWPTLIKQWCRADEVFNQRYGPLENLKLRINLMLTIFLSFTIAFVILAICQVTGIKHIQHGIFSSNDVPVSLPNNVATVVIFYFLKITAILLQLFSDFFVMLICSVIALRFKQLSTRLELTENLRKPSNFWLIIRQDYNLLANLFGKINDDLGGILVATFFMHIYRLLCFLYFSLVIDGFSIISLTNLNFWFVGQFLALSSYVAWVNVESLKPIKVLNSVPSSEFDLEILRLLSQISCDEVALTPCKIFKVTQRFLLSMANIIVTYELVLIQFKNFSSNQQRTGRPN